MGFLPPDFEVQQNTGYMKFEVGANKFRVVGEPIIGNLYWVETADGKRPRRKKLGESIPMNEVGDDGVKQFVAFVVFNYKLNKLQILEITQKTVLQALNDLDKNPDWGDLRDFDVTVTRTGKTKNDTKFTVTPSPKKDLAEDVKAIISNTPIKLDELWNNGDPFKVQPGGNVTQAETVVDDIGF